MTEDNDHYPEFTFIAVDVETTGLDSKKDDIIEIGAVKFKNDEVVDSFQSFINIGRPLPISIKTLTHISDEDIINAPSLKIVLNDFLKFLGKEILCFHNAKFDIDFINSAMEKSVLKRLYNDFYDTLEISRIFTPYLKSHSLIKLCEFFNINSESMHRALSDAKATGELFLKLTKYIITNFEVLIINQIVTLSSFAHTSSILEEYLTKIRTYLTKISLQLIKKKARIEDFFPLQNVISNIKKDERPSAIFSENEIIRMFEKGGQIAENFKQYEFRQGQIDMAAWVTEAYKDGKTLIVEAGTGVGKSLSYLIPSIFFSKFSKKRIIISTNTKNLQEQLFYKDIPTIQNVTDLTFSAVLLKGRRNYLCLRKWNQVIGDVGGHLTPYETMNLLYLIVWVENTHTGDIEENFSFIPSRSSLWSKIASDGTSCYGRKCSFFDQCFLMKIRKQAEKSHLVVINHSLLISDAVTEHSVLGNYLNLVIDEAHNLPQVAAIHFGFSINLLDIRNITKKIITKGEFQYGIANNIRIGVVKSTLSDDKKKFLQSKLDEIVTPIDNFKSVAKDFFNHLNHLVIDNGSYGKLRFKDLSPFTASKKLVEDINYHLSELFKQINTIYNELITISSNIFPFYDENIADLEGVLNQIEELQIKFQHTFSPDFENFAYWLETKDKEFYDERYPHCSIICAPIEVNQNLYDFFWSKLESVILTSATLAIRDEFKFYKHLTGLDKLEENKLMEYIASSPFDYSKQMQILIPDFLPNPRDTYFSSQAISLLEEILSVHNRGTLILFTAYKDLDKAFHSLYESTSINQVTLLAQGKSGSRTSILDAFRKEENSVLLGTKSFWEGIDVQGKSLEILILYRLPFLVPTEPLVEAYLDKLRSEGKNSFLHYLLPISLLHFKQGFGRLIRNKTDKGVVVILDSRIFKKDYGKYFVKVMPIQPLKLSSHIEITDYITGWFKEK
ncbi:MAG: 3'-5' exoribonuclease [Candidatus Cloacimonetes bacterium]|nr:3'-5' exoribonuclease [Candidatus Cloacimonadota bacterium]